MCRESLFIDVQAEEKSVSSAVLQIREEHAGLFHLCHVIFITETSGEGFNCGKLESREIHEEARKRRHCQHPPPFTNRRQQCAGLP